MGIKALRTIDFTGDNPKFEKSYTEFGKLLTELNKRDLPNHLVEQISQHINEVNASSIQEKKKLIKQVKKQQTKILSLVEKTLKIVPKGYYRNRWMVLGMTAFGLPFGVVFGMSLGNIAFLGIGLPIGMGIGLAVGNGLDKKAFNEDRQLDFEMASP